MEEKNNIYDMAVFCQARYKEEFSDKNNKYIKTIYVAIDEDNNIKTSTTPHILKNATQAILIHQRSSLAISRWYSWYKVEFLDNEGCVHDDSLDDSFDLRITSHNGFANQIMTLRKDSQDIYRCSGPWDKDIKLIWNLYLKCKECSSTSEAILLGKLVMKEQHIIAQENEIKDLKYTNLLLQEERKQYESLLASIEKLLNKE